MYETEVPCPCSKSQPGVRGQFQGPLGAFVAYCNISCFLCDGQALPGDLSCTWTGLVYYRNNFFCGLYLCVKAGKLLKK